jgi:hypothetical protein
VRPGQLQQERSGFLSKGVAAAPGKGGEQLGRAAEGHALPRAQQVDHVRRFALAPEEIGRVAHRAAMEKGIDGGHGGDCSIEGEEAKLRSGYNHGLMPASPRRRFRWICLLWLIAPLPLWWALRGIRPADVLAALGRLGPGPLAALVAVNVLTLLSFSARWWIILRAQGHPLPYLTLTGYRLASFGVSYFTPGPQFGGEPLQVYLLQRRHGVPGPVSAAATALDKILELLVNFAVLMVGLMLLAAWGLFPGLTGAPVIGALLALIALPVGFLAAAWGQRRPLTWMMERLPARTIQSPGFQRIYGVVLESEQQVSDFCRAQMRALLWALAASALSWALILYEYWLSMSFLGLRLTPRQLITAVTINRLAFLVPLPGGLGALESGQVLAMTLLGLDPALGITQSLVIRARDVLAGGLGLWLGGHAAFGPQPQRQP